MEGKRVLRYIARHFNNDPPELVQRNFATTLIEEARLISNYELFPVPVKNMLLDHGKNFIVSAF